MRGKIQPSNKNVLQQCITAITAEVGYEDDEFPQKHSPSLKKF